MDKPMEQLFHEATGGEWHEEIEWTSNKLPCSCGELFKHRFAFNDHAAMVNPTYTNPVDTIARLRAVPCGECEATGKIPCPSVIFPHAECEEIEHNCPTCSGKGTVDLYDDFAEWHWDELDEFNIGMEDRRRYGSNLSWSELTNLTAQVNAEILLTPHYLMTAINSFLKGRD